jgi:hypothetical protein
VRPGSAAEDSEDDREVTNEVDDEAVLGETADDEDEGDEGCEANQKEARETRVLPAGGRPSRGRRSSHGLSFGNACLKRDAVSAIIAEVLPSPAAPGSRGIV